MMDDCAWHGAGRRDEYRGGSLLRGTAGAVAAFTIVPGHVLAGAAGQRPSEKLNLAAIGVGGMGDYNIKQCSTENFVALCDVDDKYAAKVFDRFPNARKYKDFRVMLDKEDKNIDGVIIATPDHTHCRDRDGLPQARQTHLPSEAAGPLDRRGAQADRGGPRGQGPDADGQPGPLLRRDSHAVRMDRGWGHRPGARGVRLERPAGGRRPVVGFPDHGQAERDAAGARDARLGPVAGPGPVSALPSDLLPDARGAAGGISAPAPWATWAATSSTRPSGP